MTQAALREGEMDLDPAKIEDPFARSLAERTIEKDAARRRFVAPPGAIPFIPPLLEERRLGHGITDGAFRTQPVFDKVYIWQIDFTSATLDKVSESSNLVIPISVKKGLEQEASRGILVGAGAQALDQLSSHGIGLGHIVNFTKLAPFRQKVDHIEGVDYYMCTMHAGDIIGSEDLRAAMAAGKVRVERRKNDDGKILHVYVDENGNDWIPTEAWESPEY